MTVRKYLFWLFGDGIKTYKVTEKGKFEVLRPAGRDVYEDTDLSEFFRWFQKSAAITEDEFIDFCFLSEQPIEFPLLEYMYSARSSWDKQAVGDFCRTYMNFQNFEVFYADEKCFVCQSGNVRDKAAVKRLYMKCIPEFSDDAGEVIDKAAEETSIPNRYFIEMLEEQERKLKDR